MCPFYKIDPCQLSAATSGLRSLERVRAAPRCAAWEPAYRPKISTGDPQILERRESYIIAQLASGTRDFRSAHYLTGVGRVARDVSVSCILGGPQKMTRSFASYYGQNVQVGHVKYLILEFCHYSRQQPDSEQAYHYCDYTSHQSSTSSRIPVRSYSRASLRKFLYILNRIVIIAYHFQQANDGVIFCCLLSMLMSDKTLV